MKRDKTWGQDDPITQLRAILGSIEGDMLNVEGVLSQAPARLARTVSRVLKHVKDSQKLAEAIAKGDTKWDDEG